jgi:hypothetical protein
VNVSIVLPTVSECTYHCIQQLNQSLLILKNVNIGIKLYSFYLGLEYGCESFGLGLEFIVARCGLVLVCRVASCTVDMVWVCS